MSSVMGMAHSVRNSILVRGGFEEALGCLPSGDISLGRPRSTAQGMRGIAAGRRIGVALSYDVLGSSFAHSVPR